MNSRSQDLTQKSILSMIVCAPPDMKLHAACEGDASQSSKGRVANQRRTKGTQEMAVPSMSSTKSHPSSQIYALTQSSLGPRAPCMLCVR